MIGPYELNSIIHGDCLEVMPRLPDRSVDMILADLPYGTTACEWDSIIPLEPLWKQYKRVIKPGGAIVLTADEPFSSILVVNDLDWFKYKWIWKKTVAANFMNAKLRPLEVHEEVLVFSSGKTSNGNSNNMVYNPQGLRQVNQKWSRPAKYPSEHNFVRPSHKLERTIEFTGYPESVIEFPNGNNSRLHPTQKPVALFAYLIRTYSNPGDLVLDNTAGSCTYLFVRKRDGWGRMETQGIRRRLRRLCEELKIPYFKPHQLRHSYALQSLRNGASLPDVSHQLGHIKPSTTDRYIIAPEVDRAEIHLASSPRDH